MKYKSLILALAVAANAAGAEAPRSIIDGGRVVSPDGKVAVEFRLQAVGFPAYQVEYRGQPIVVESRLGFDPDFTNAFEFVSAVTNQHEGQWNNAFGERRMVPDNYRELRVELKHKSGRLLSVIFRACDEGAG